VQAKIVWGLSRRFVQISAEAPPGPADAGLRGIVEAAERVLRELLGLSLANVVRTRLWGRTAADRTAASAVRRLMLDGPARAASSSYVDAAHFAGPGSVALDLVAMEPAGADARKRVVELDPPAAPPMFVAYDGLVFLSGLCLAEPTLAAAVPKTVEKFASFMERAGVSWVHAIHLASYVARPDSLIEMERLLNAAAPVHTVTADYSLVDGHAVPGAHVEIEVTARVP
jgi:enamine deaminase RidA (YjgF/YER057c/UK114 family)